jgi:hypothetical protein
VTIRLALPEWVRTIRLHDVETATREFTDLLAAAQERGRVGRGELESAASQVVEEAFEQGVRVLGLVRPPGRPAALLSVLGLDLGAPLDDRALRAFLLDRGGPGICGLRSFDVEGVGRVVTLHRSDASGAQAQAVLADPDGENWYLLTLAAQDTSRGAELQDLLVGLIRHGAVDSRPE